jgi:hypothetical protein
MIRAIVAGWLALSAIAYGDAAIPDGAGGEMRCEGYEAWAKRTAVLVGETSDGSVVLRHQGPYTIHESQIRGNIHRTLVTDAASGQKRFEVLGGPIDLLLGGDQRIEGALAIEEKEKLDFYDASARHQWSIVSVDFDRAVAVIDGSSLIVALYQRSSTGARLYRFDRATGKTQWEADVYQLDADHSIYFNDVRLTKRGGQIVMHGEEAGGCYLQVFDAKTGKRVSTQIGKVGKVGAPATR